MNNDEAQVSKPHTFDELKALRYDLTVDLYRQRARELEVEAKADHQHPLEYRLYKILGPDLMGSIAFALDPYWQLQLKARKDHMLSSVYPVTISPAVRKRIFPCIWPITIRSTERHHGETIGNDPVFNGAFWTVGPLYRFGVVDQDHSGVLGTQGLVNGFVVDSTDKTRNGSASDRKWSNSGALKDKRQRSKGLIKGEGCLELFKSSLTGTQTSYSYLQTSADTFQRQAVTGPGGSPINTVARQRISRWGSANAPCAKVDPTAVSNYLTFERTYASNLMSAKAEMLFERCLPKGRQYNLAYQIGELKDLPKLIWSLHDKLVLWKLFEQKVGVSRFKNLLTSASSWSKEFVNSYGSYLKNLGLHDLDKEIANLYLEFKFGWQSLYQAIDQLIRSPQSIGRKVNYLVARNGKNVVLRSSIRYVEPMTTSFPPVSMLQMNLLNTDASIPNTNIASKDVQLRCMIAGKVNFPKVDLPNLKVKLWTDKLGLTPSPGDIYDLVPWTWMIDWFGGLGDYIHLMDAVNDDHFIINYGFLTYISKLTVIANQYTYGQCSQTTTVIPPNTTTGGSFRSEVRAEGIFTSKYQLRRDLSDFATGVKKYSGQGLSPFQSSILTALFSKYR